MQVSLLKFTNGIQEIIHAIYWMHHKKHPHYADSLNVEVQRSAGGDQNPVDGGTRNKDFKNWIWQDGHLSVTAGKTEVQCSLLESKT
jgi:hypothetical protein